jgi:hypothetical protein
MPGSWPGDIAYLALDPNKRELALQSILDSQSQLKDRKYVGHKSKISLAADNRLYLSSA